MTDRLLAARAASAERIADMTAELAAVAAASTDANLDDEHDPEGATVAFERQQLAAALDAARSRLADLDAALARTADGNYGICQRCGSPIAEERLDALPAAVLCAPCASATARGR